MARPPTVAWRRAGDEVVLLKTRENGREPAVVHLVVGVHEGDPAARAVGHAHVAGISCAGLPLGGDDTQGEAIPEPFGDLTGSVGGAVVADQDLPGPVDVLPGQCLQLRSKGWRPRSGTR